MPGAGVVGGDLGDELEAVGNVEGSPGLVAVGAGLADVAGPTTVGAQSPVVPTLALLWGEGSRARLVPSMSMRLGSWLGRGRRGWMGGVGALVWNGRRGAGGWWLPLLEERASA